MFSGGLWHPCDVMSVLILMLAMQLVVLASVSHCSLVFVLVFKVLGRSDDP